MVTNYIIMGTKKRNTGSPSKQGIRYAIRGGPSFHNIRLESLLVTSPKALFVSLEGPITGRDFPRGQSTAPLGKDTKDPIMEKSLNPYFFSGFVQADGRFHVSIQKDHTAKHKIRLKPLFYVTSFNSKSKKISPVLRMARNLLQVGHYIPDRRNNCSTLCVNTLKDLMNNVLGHFDLYPLVSEKKKDYLLFKEIVTSMTLRLHLTEQGFSNILRLVALMNKKGAYPQKYTQ